MKSKQIILLIIAVFLFEACEKKHFYSCSCQITVSVYNEDPIKPFYTYHYYNTEQPIQEKLTQKQAKDACDKTEKSLEFNLRNLWYLGGVSGTCVVK